MNPAPPVTKTFTTARTLPPAPPPAGPLSAGIAPLGRGSEHSSTGSAPTAPNESRPGQRRAPCVIPTNRLSQPLAAKRRGRAIRGHFEVKVESARPEGALRARLNSPGVIAPLAIAATVALATEAVFSVTIGAHLFIISRKGEQPTAKGAA